VQNAINPQPHQRPVPFGLNVNIACPLLKGVVKQIFNRIFYVLIG